MNLQVRAIPVLRYSTDTLIARVNYDRELLIPRVEQMH